MSDVDTFTITTRGGMKLRADRLGDPASPCAILMHGGGQTRYAWQKEMLLLGDAGYSVISYDARGHGDSDWAPDGDYSIDAYAADLDAVLAHTGRPRALIGASLGGLTAFYSIGAHAESVADALVLVDITPNPVKSGSDRIQRFMRAHLDGFASIDAAVAAVAEYRPDGSQRPDSSKLRRNLRERADGRLYWHWDPRLLDRPEGSDPRSIVADAMRVGGGVKIPTLLVRGGRSDIVDDAGVAMLRSLVPQSVVFDVPAAGHTVVGDDNSTFHEGILTFLTRHVPARHVPARHDHRST